MIVSRLFAAGAPSAYQPYGSFLARGSRRADKPGAHPPHAGRDEPMKRSMIGIIFVALSMISGLAISSDFDHQHKTYAEVLENYVEWSENGTASTVDYKTLKTNPENLNQYLQQLSGVEKSQFENWNSDQQLAYLINTYNAYTLKLIIDHYPEDSIRDIGPFWKTPWEIEFIPLFGEKRSLDHIEHQRIREPGVYNEPRIHFAVNCASIGCPALRTEPFTADQLEQQLEDSTKRFLRDETRNRYVDGELQVSPLFKWYRKDFQRGWNGVDSLNEFFLRYAEALDLNEAQRQALKNDNVAYKFLDYDWSLNEKE